MKTPILITMSMASTALLCSHPVALAQAHVVTQWHAHAQTLVASFTGRGNAAQAYTAALIQVAVYDATVAVRGAQPGSSTRHKPFIADLVAPAGADLNAAIATAAFRVGHDRVDSNPTARSSYRSAYDAYLAGVPEGQAKADGVAVGEAGIDFCSDRDLDAPRLHLTSTLAHLRLLQGRWDDADGAARLVLDAPQATPLARFWALVASARLRARRGDPGVWVALDEALDLAATGGVQMQLSCCRARAEAAWLEGRDDDAAREATAALPRAIERHLPGLTAELVLWARRGGLAHPVPQFCAAQPAALEAAAQWQQAAAAWRAAGCPFETARALADGDEAAQRDALATFERLGARPMVERVRHRLRRAGVRGLARGPRASTQRHPAGLTTVEIEVLSLLGAGLRSKEIAARLHRSPRTVDHHLQAIFAKLGVATRTEAVTAALRLGVASTPR